ncbi:MAG: hypothetical protein HYU52_16430 [Acidobacteria bacterium]|nr:hypothetical protein [Acidobacteriota bacterium]
MTKHYGTGELLTHAYMSSEDAELSRHVAECDACGRRLAAVRSELERHAANEMSPEKSETFWKRQELAVMRAIETRNRRALGIPTQIAAAAAVVFVVTAFLAGRGSVSSAPDMTTSPTATVASVETNATAVATQENGLTTRQITTDPWQSEQLEDFQNVVDWESWVEADEKKRGTI